ncbi:nitroreductase family protein [Chloroflexus sp. MS-G]|jgi:F420 biosynthesis protein FbiB-like protein|uniref:nitroreductase family protein n=1 Tax=Chloroflexus sp. MS-G TaxID=1521187 RepID=UPI0004DF662A|nr:nitroreductase family protein [Chloroflexus sp. MS-G]
MDFFTLVQNRRTVRAFRPDPPPREAIEQILWAASWAPSPHGRQPWRFVVVESHERKATLAAAMAETWRYHLALDGHDPATIEQRLQRSQARVLNAPVIIIPCLYLNDLDVYPDAERQAAETTMAIQSLGCAVQNMLLAAFALGLAAGWMCAPLFAPAAVRTALGLAADLHPQALIPIGYLAQEPKRRPRRSLDELVVQWL